MTIWWVVSARGCLHAAVAGCGWQNLGIRVGLSGGIRLRSACHWHPHRKRSSGAVIADQTGLLVPRYSSADRCTPAPVDRSALAPAWQAGGAIRANSGRSDGDAQVTAGMIRLAVENTQSFENTHARFIFEDTLPPDSPGGAGKIAWMLGQGSSCHRTWITFITTTQGPTRTETRRGLQVHALHSDYPHR